MSTNMLNNLKAEANLTTTENLAITHASTMSDCLDLFATIGAIRFQDDNEIINHFMRAYTEDSDTAMKILFFGRDVRGGLGERRVFRVMAKWLAINEPEPIRKNLALIPEYGRFDDLLTFIDTPCEDAAIDVIRTQLEKDLASNENVSLLAKWLPSVNASNAETVRMAKRIARALGMSDMQYRKTLSQLRKRIHIVENDLRERDYSFDYEELPSKALLKYRQAFIRNDNSRYEAFLENVKSGKSTMHTGTLMPYEVIRPCIGSPYIWNQDHDVLTESERIAIDTTWNALEDFAGDENALVVVDGSGSMYGSFGKPLPIEVALSLGIYFAERNTGIFHNHFITFSETPQLVEIKGRDITEKVRYCMSYNEVANTNLQAVFELILKAAIKNHASLEDMPKRLFIISDMEFDYCMDDAEETNFARAKKLFVAHGYNLPEVIFWNVNSRNRQQPVTKNEQGVTLVSGCTPRLFSMVLDGATPYEFMMEVIGSERYAKIAA